MTEEQGATAPSQSNFRARLKRVLAFMGRPLRWAVDLALVLAAVLVTLAVGKALVSFRLPDLKPWHRVRLQNEFVAKDLASTRSLEDYLRREDRLFAEVREKIVDRLAPEDRLPGNRYYSGGRMTPEAFGGGRDWNRTTDLSPSGPVKGGVLLLHGLTDSPYKMRALAEIYRDAGYYALVLRLPGHGTIPSGLLDTGGKDWRAAVLVGARAVRAKVGPGVPFHVVGYSNGGALALQYAMECVEGSGEPAPDRLVLLSPMIGVSPFAKLSRLLGSLGRFQVFEKARWLDVMPEYIPYKYCSFPLRAGYESYLLTTSNEAEVERLQKAGRLGQLPPILLFTSVVDATVVTSAMVEGLFARLPEGRKDEIVAFDLNDGSQLGPFIKDSEHGRLVALLANPARAFRLTAVMNERPGTMDVVERSAGPHSSLPEVRPLGLAWPAQIYSLSHLSVPIPPEDPLYGEGRGIGAFAPRGEKGVLLVPEDQFMRLNWNPFFPYLRDKLEAFIASPAPTP